MTLRNLYKSNMYYDYEATEKWFDERKDLTAEEKVCFKKRYIDAIKKLIKEII